MARWAISIVCQLSDFNNLIKSGDAEAFRSIPQVSANRVPTFST